MVSKYSKFVFLLFALLLSLGGIRKENFEEKLHISLQEVEDESSGTYFSESKLHKAFCLQPPSGNLVSPVTNLPVPVSKNHLNALWPAPLFVELGIQQWASQYLLRSKEIDRSLPISDIIYPFHYFW